MAGEGGGPQQACGPGADLGGVEARLAGGRGFRTALGNFRTETLEESVDGRAHEAGMAGAFAALKFASIGLSEGN
jgi:hypothetical protein